MANDAEIIIGADSSLAKAEFNKLGNEAQEAGLRIQSSMRGASFKMAEDMKVATTSMKHSMEGVQGHFEKINKGFMVLTAALAGGAALKESIEATVEMTKSANALGKSLGITATQASILNVALDDVYLSQDTINAANQRLTKTLGNNEKAFKDIGVATRDANGHFKSSLDIMLDTNTALLKFKEGIDRNVEGQKIYGKSWGEVQGILRLTKQGMEESAEKARELGLIVGQENVEATAKYRAAMNDVNDVMEAVKKAVGDALLPILTELGQWCSSIGPGLVLVFKGAIGGLAAAFHSLVLGFRIGCITIATAFLEVIEIGKTFGKVMWAVLHGDLKGAQEAASQGWKNMKNQAAESFDVIAKDAQDTADKINNLFSNPTGTSAKSGGATSEGKSGKEKKQHQESALSAWRAQLERQLELEKNYFKESLQEEIAFWTKKLAVTKAGSKDRMAVEHELFILHKREAQQNLQDETASLKLQSEAARAGGIERIRIAEDIAKKIGAKYGLESKEYKATLNEIRKAVEEHQRQLEKLADMRLDRQKQHSLNALEIERDRLKTQKDLGEITDVQELKALLQLEERKYQIEYSAALERAKLIDNDVVAQQEAYDKLATMAEKHAQDIAKINDQVRVAEKNEWDQYAKPITNAFEKSVNGIIQGTLTLQKAFKNIFKSIAAEFVALGVKMVTQWAFNQLRMTAATVIGVNARNAAEQAGAGQSMLLQAGTAIKKILNAAFETFAGVFSFLSGFMGPAAAGPAAASMGVVAATAGSIAFAAQGYDIPAGINPMVQAHQKEMILPAEQADVIRGLAGGASGGAIVINASGGDFIHKNDLAKLLKQMNRNFILTK